MRREEAELAAARALRDAAQEQAKARAFDVKDDLGSESIARRAARRMGEGAQGFVEDAKGVSPTTYAAILGGLGIMAAGWFARRPIIGFLQDAIQGSFTADDDNQA